MVTNFDKVFVMYQCYFEFLVDPYIKFIKDMTPQNAFCIILVVTFHVAK